MTEPRPDPSPDTSPEAQAAAPNSALAETPSGAPGQSSEPRAAATQTTTPQTTEPPPSFVKLAMRNMVRKGRQSLLHFGLTAVGFIGFILLVAWFGRPTLPQ